MLRQIFVPEFTNKGWYSAEQVVEGWYDNELTETVSAPTTVSLPGPSTMNRLRPLLVR